MHRFKERNVPIMDISFALASEPRDLNPMDCRFFLQMFQGLFQVQIPTAQKIDVDLGRGRGTKGSDRPLRTLPLGLLFGQLLPLHPAWQERFRQAPDFLVSLVAHDHDLSAHLQVEEGRRDIASRGPSVWLSGRWNILVKFGQPQRSLLQLTQDCLPQIGVFGQPRSGFRPPSSPRLGKGLRIPSHQGVVERIILGEHDRSGVGPMFEDFLLVPEESVQVRQPKVADPAPEDEDMGRCDRVDRVQLNVAEVANHGEDRIPCRTGRPLASKMLLRDSEAPRGFQGRRDGRFTQRVWLPDVAAINLGALTGSFRGTAFGVLMVPALLQSRPMRRRTWAKAPCHRSDNLDNLAKPDASLDGRDGSTGPGSTVAARRRLYVLRMPHSIGIGGGVNETSPKLESREPVCDLSGTWSCIRCDSDHTNATDSPGGGWNDGKLPADLCHSHECDTRRERTNHVLVRFGCAQHTSGLHDGRTGARHSHGFGGLRTAP